MHVTLRVPIRTCGGAWFADTISAMKLAVMPMMAMREMTCMPRTTVKVAPRAPNCGPGILAVGGGGDETVRLGLMVGGSVSEVDEKGLYKIPLMTTGPLYGMKLGESGGGVAVMACGDVQKLFE